MTLLFSHLSMTAYVSECCNLAVEQFFDRAVYSAMAEVLQNVAVRMTRYNSEVFEEYTSILDEIGKILREDAVEFSVFSPWMKDTILEGIGKLERCKYYLDDCIRDGSVDALAHQLLRSMRDDKEKWLTQTHVNNFDVVHEVRTLMDQCLIQYHMDLGLTDFRFASPADMASKYCDIPVPVEDVFKWLRKSVRYMDILEKDYKLFS